MSSDRIFLGSVQFGLDYGISNKNGSPSDEELLKILDLAKASGIRGIDSAQAYGNAEKRLGSQALDTFELVGKIAPHTASSEIRNSCLQSLKELGIEKFHGLLAHRFEDALEDPAWWEEMCRLKEEGLVQKIGFSIYTPNQLDVIDAKSFDFDLIQLPYNLYDKRFESSLSALKARGIEIHARSIFLQGLLFLESVNLSAHFERIRDHHSLLHKEISRMNSSVLKVSLTELVHETRIDRLVLGVNSAAELKEILDCISAIDSGQVPTLEGDWRLEDESVLLPQNWT